MVIFTVIPAPPTIIPDPPSRHSGESRNLRAAMDSGFPVIPIFPSFRLPQPSFRRKPESTRRDRLRFSRHSDFPVIPAKAGIYALRWTPVFPSFRIPQPSFRRKPESTRRDGLQFSHHSEFFRHSGASRNLRAAMDSGFRRNDGSIPKLGGSTFRPSAAAPATHPNHKALLARSP